MKWNAAQRSIVGVLGACAVAECLAEGITNFGTITIVPAFELDGAGMNVDSIAFWEAPDPDDTLMLVTGKDNDVVEVWKYPFQGNELAPRQFPSGVNGVVVDQETDLLYVSDRVVSVLSLPGLLLQGEFGQGIIGVGENNLDILRHADGRTLIYVSEDHNVHWFDAVTANHLGSFAPPVTSIETVLADDYYQMILVPEEQGFLGSPGVYAYHPDGTPFERSGTNRFGNAGEFDSDEEGILLYTFPSNGTGDNGTGFIVVTDQKSDLTDFEFFDRLTWSHLGTLRLAGVSNTDGIASTQRALPDYPLGLFVAINNDSTTVGVGWDVIFEAMGWTAYRVWAATHGLVPGVNDGFADDPDADGVPNLEEFALDGQPLGGGGDGKERVVFQEVDATSYLTSTFPVRDPAMFVGAGPLSATVDGVVYTLSGSADLVDLDAGVVEMAPALEAGLPLLNRGWSYRTIRMSTPVPGSSAGFLLRRTAAETP